MSTFDGWAVVELLGHRVRYGRATEVTLFGEAFCKIEIPSEPPVVEFYSGKAIYGIRPASEEAIRAYHAPRKALAAPVGPCVEESFEDDLDDEPDDDSGPPGEVALCGACDEPLGDQFVTVDVDDERQLWHAQCARDHALERAGMPSDQGAVDSDQPRGDL